MKKSEFRGLSSVYRYTITQTLKTKSFVVTTIVLLLFACLVFPVMNFINSDKADSKKEAENKEYKDEDLKSFKVYVNNQSGIETIDYNAYKEANKKYQKLEFVDTDLASDKVLEEAKANDAEAVYLTISLDMKVGMYKIEAGYATLSEKVTDKFASNFTDWFRDYKKDVLKLSDKALAALDTVLNVDEINVDKYVSEKEIDILSSSEYNVVYAIVMVVYFLIVFSASAIANRVVEEKANRVVEYLLTTVRPMALILGKVLAALTITIGQIAVLAVAAVGSNNLSAKILGVGGRKSALSSLISFDAMQNLNVVTLIIFILVTGFGILTYGLLAGLCGATVSKMEDIQQGLRIYNVVIVVCFLVDVVACQLMWTVGLNAFTTFTLLCPLTSPFLLPGALVIGKVNTVIIIIAIVLLVVVSVLVLKFVSMVYEAVIVMNGDPVTAKKLIKIAKDRRKQA